MSSKIFSPIELDAIGEILNISLGASATAISTMLTKRVDITTPHVEVVDFDEFDYTEMDPAIGVEITYVSGLSGSNIMLLKRHDVKVIVELLMGVEMSDEEFELNEMNMSAVCEVMNQMMGASSTALSEFLGEVVNISTPVSYEIEDIKAFKEKCFNGEEQMVVINFNLKIDELIESRFMNLMPTKLAKKLVSAFGLGDYIEEEKAAEPDPAPLPLEEPSNKMMSQEEIEALISGGAPKEEAPAGEPSNKMMSQEEIEALISGGAPKEEAPAGEPSNKMMSQEEIEALISGGAPKEEAPAEEPSGKMMSQEEIEALISGGAAKEEAQTEKTSAAKAQDAPPQAAQQMPPYPPYPPYPTAMQVPEGYPQAPPGYPPMYGYGYYPPYGYPPVPPQQQEKAPKEEPKMINARPVETHQFGAAETIGEEQAENLELIMDVPLEISVEIGRTKKPIKEILELASGSLVVLDKLAGEQVDIYANGQCIAKGDVVVVDDNFGVRITEIIKNEVEKN